MLFEKKNGRPFSFATTQAIIRKRKRKRKDLGGERKKTGLGKKRPSWEASLRHKLKPGGGKKKPPGEAIQEEKNEKRRKNTSLGGHPVAPQLEPGEVHERPLGHDKIDNRNTLGTH